MPIEETYDNRLAGTVNMLIQFARGNFHPRMALSENDDNLNTITTGLNMLGDELQHYKSELSTKNNFLETILETIDQIIYVIDTDQRETKAYMRHTFVSAPLERILGYSKEDILSDSHKLCQFVFSDDRQMVLETFYSVIETGIAAPCIYRVIHKYSGELIWLEDKMIPQKNDLGEVVQVVGCAKDITERKKSEEQIIEQKKFTEKILNLLPVDIAVLDTDHRYSFINPAAVGNSELREWLIGKDDFDYCVKKEISMEMAENRRKIFLEAERKGTDIGWMDTYTGKHGETHYKLRRFLPVIENGIFKYAIGYGIDITELKKASLENEKLIRELNNKFNELMQFNYIVSHNLRSPVASIMGLISLLESDLPEEEKKRAIGFLSQAANSIDTTIKDLNLILASKSPLNEKVEPFLLSHVVNEVRNNLSQQIEDSGAAIWLNVTKETDQLSSIKSYIQSVIYNLISNAIKYRSTERTPCITISVFKEKDATTITVSDNGIGIDLEQYGKQVFGLYKRFHLKTEGKGLGLYMSKMQLESLGGSIEVNSIPGEGTTFKIKIG